MTDNGKLPDAKIVLTHDGNWNHVVMMVLDYLCLSIHSLKILPVGVSTSELIKEITLMNGVKVDSGK